MAKRTTRGGAKDTGPRQSKATSRKGDPKAAVTSAPAAPAAASAAEVEIVEEAGGAGVETAIAVFTFLALVTAFVLVDYVLGKSFGEGLFFKG